MSDVRQRRPVRGHTLNQYRPQVVQSATRRGSSGGSRVAVRTTPASPPALRAAARSTRIMWRTGPDASPRERAEVRAMTFDHPSGTYVVDFGPHEGHTATIVAREMPGARFDGKWFVPENWVFCECGEQWGYVDSSADEAAKDGDGWPE